MTLLLHRLVCLIGLSCFIAGIVIEYVGIPEYKKHPKSSSNSTYTYNDEPDIIDYYELMMFMAALN